MCSLCLRGLARSGNRRCNASHSARGGFGGGGHIGGFGPRITGRSVALDRFDRDHRFFFRHHHFRNFAFFGAPLFRIRSLAVLLRLRRLRWVLAPGMATMATSSYL